MSFAIMTITPNAAERIREIIEDADDTVCGVRVGVRNAGCAGMAYTLDHVREPDPADDHVAIHGVDVWVDPKATMFLLGTEMDFESGRMSSGFTFNNPNQKSACGCGESVQLEAADLEELARIRASSQSLSVE